MPEGWRRVESRSRPGEFVYENIHTEERQSWFPEIAAAEEGEWSRCRKQMAGAVVGKHLGSVCVAGAVVAVVAAAMAARDRKSVV